MPFKNIDDRKKWEKQYNQRTEVKEHKNKLYKERYDSDINGVRTKKRKQHYDRYKDPEYKEKRKQHYYKRWERDWVGQKLTQIKARAKRKGLEFNLERSDIILPEKCPIFGIPLIVHVGDKKQYNDSPSVDRIDNSKGYIKGNVVVVSLKANSIKREASMDDLRKIIQFYETLTEDYPNE